jgi:hypothetical protein
MFGPDREWIRHEIHCRFDASVWRDGRYAGVAAAIGRAA